MPANPLSFLNSIRLFLSFLLEYHEYKKPKNITTPTEISIIVSVLYLFHFY